MGKIVLHSPVVTRLHRYARLFVARSSASCNGAQEITDLWGTMEELQDIARLAFRTGHDNELANVSSALHQWDEDELLNFMFRQWLSFTSRRRSGFCWKLRRLLQPPRPKSAGRLCNGHPTSV